MPAHQRSPRDWHRWFGLILADFFSDSPADFFSDSPFAVEIERDLSEQQQCLDVVILRRGPGRMTVRLPDGLEGLVAHNLVTFKSRQEVLDSWAMKELVGHYVAYRKLVSPSPSELLPEDRFQLYPVCARFPEQLSGQVQWQQHLPGVYDCLWGTDTVRVIVAGRLAREKHNAPLHLFSASPELVGFGRRAYCRRSEDTSLVLSQLIEETGGPMAYTMADFKRDYFARQLRLMKPEDRRKLLEGMTRLMEPEDRRKLLEGLPPEERLAGLSAEEIQRYLDRRTSGARSSRRKAGRKK